MPTKLLSLRTLLCSALGIALTSLYLYWPESEPYIESGELTNGLQYHLYDSENDDDGFNIRILVNAGGVDEAGTAGVAHMVEHMVFNATEQHSSVHAYLEQIGWKTGSQLNASTNSTRTQYMIRAQRDDALNLNQSLALLHQMVAKAEMKADQFELERKIITGEWRQVVDQKRRQGYLQTNVLMAGSKFAGRTTIGGHTAIQQARLDELKSFYKRWYIPRNMQLIITGDIDIDAAKRQIETLFASMPDKPLPQRRYRSIALKPGLSAGIIQNHETRRAKVTYGFRFNLPPAGTEAGAQSRAQNYLLIQTVRQMLAEQFQNSDKPIAIRQRSLTRDQNSWLFEHATDNHEASLLEMIAFVKYLKLNGLDEAILKQQIELLQEQTEKQIEREPAHNHAQIEKQLSDALSKQIVYQSPRTRNKILLKWLDKLTIADLNDTLNKLINSQDQVLIYQAPEGIELDLPSFSKLNDWQRTIKPAIPKIKTTETVNSSEPIATLPELVLADGSINGYNFHPDQNVHEWQLDNGDRVIWLEQSTEDKKLHLQLQTEVGLDQQENSRWKNRLAFQLWERSPLQNWDIDTWYRWRSEQKLQWKWQATNQHYRWSAQSTPEQLGELLHLYQVRMQLAGIDEKIFAKRMANMTKSLRLPNKQQQVSEQLLALRFGKIPQGYKAPEESDLNNLDRNEVLALIHQIRNQPVTLFISGEIDKEELEQLILKRLSTLSRTASLTPYIPESADGIRATEFDISPAGSAATKADVVVETYKQFTGAAGLGIRSRLLGLIANEQLRKYMRLEVGAVYTVGYRIWRNKDNQIQTRLSFITAPEQAEELLQKSQQILLGLRTDITQAELDRAKTKLKQLNQRRKRAGGYHLSRLVYSYDKFGDPRLLNQTIETDSVSSEDLKALALELFPSTNQLTLVTLKQ